MVGERALEGKFVVLGVTGGIAAYKAVEVCRRLVDLGAHVAPVMTKEATRFVGEVTFSSLASEPVRTSMWSESEPIPHTWLGQHADVIVVVPATAHFIASYAIGLSDNLLASTVIATRAPVVICPAMHTEMWEHLAVQENLQTLRRRGVHVVWPESGRLAGGDSGLGRLAEPARIVDEVTSVVLGSSVEMGHSLPERDLEGVRVLVTAGGTREPI
ncbi:MAG: flavoprotein, partial [Acidimicrobiales bacterium]